MKIPDPDIYFGKYLYVVSIDGHKGYGAFDGYSFDFDDDGNEFLEIDVGPYSLAEDEIAYIEIIGDIE